MAEIKSFPNNQDVYVGAEWVMKWLHGRTSGVFGAEGNLAMTVVPDSMSVQIADGTGWLSNSNGDGIVFWNDSEQTSGSKLTLTHDVADGVLDRIDRIVVTWETTNYVALPTISILKGIASSVPAPPELTNNNIRRQISLAKVKIPAGTVSLSTSMITDERLDDSVCGLVTGGISVDTTQMQSQFDSFLKEIEDELGRLNSGTEVVLKSGGVQEPVNSDQVANKGYVDASVRKAAPYNYVHNSDFTQFIAQAGVGGLHGTQAYAGDRWILDSGTVTGEANENGNGYRNITLNGTIRQKVENPPATGNAKVETVSGTATVSYANGELTITSSGGVIKNVLFCAAETLPEYRPNGYGAELAECQRYYLRSYESTPKTSSSGPVMIFSAASGHAGGSVLFPTEMRVTPTVTLYNLDTGNSGVVCDWSNSADVTASASATRKGFFVRGGGKFTKGKYYGCHYEANADL